jgi:histidinol-phosphate aminotransferase
MKPAKRTGSPARFIRPSVRELHGYVPGEQPKISGLVKLNTNENPYPPSPAVLRAIRKSVDGRLRLYPNPTCEPLRRKLAELHGCEAENIIVGNGSDEVLALATRTFTEPVTSGGKRSASRIQFFTPSYSLYPVLTSIHGAEAAAVPLEEDFGLPPVAELKKLGWDFSAALTFVTTPNAPSGRGYTRKELEPLCAAQKGIVILDEAYVDFADENAMAWAKKYSHVIVSRTFSKAYSLCAQRIGYFVGHPELIGALQKVRDSYNVNGLGQVAAAATLDDLGYYKRNFERVKHTRASVALRLAELGFFVRPSQTNFLLAKPPRFPAENWLARLRDKKILVRWFSYPETREFLRITIGSEKEMRLFLKAVEAILAA